MEYREWNPNRMVRVIAVMLCCFMLVSVIVPAQGAVVQAMTEDGRNEAAAVSYPRSAQTVNQMAYVQVGTALGSLTELSSYVNPQTESGYAMLSLTAAAARTAGEFTAAVRAADVSAAAVQTAEPVVYDFVIAKVNDSVNIREEATTESEVVGKLYKESYAAILERQDEWTKVSSGDVTGYISNDYLYFDEDAMEVARELEAFQAEVTAGTVNVRTAPGLDSEIITEAKLGDTFTHLPELTTEEWTAVALEDGTTAYLSSQFTEESITLDTAVSAEEEAKKAEAAKIAKALEEAKKTVPATTNRAAITLSDEDMFLMAIVVTMEAASESYEGQLAVANVIVNRLLSGIWGDTISDVVYAPNQFSGANSGRIEQFSTRVTESCKKAVVEALAGNNNIGSYMSFIMKSRANYSAYSEYYILGNHCFYNR